MIFSHVSQFTWISQLFLQNPSAPGMHHNKDDGYDSHTRISYKENPGFFGQIKQSFSAALMGILLVITSFPVIYWNEVKWLPKRIIGCSTVEGWNNAIPSIAYAQFTTVWSYYCNAVCSVFQYFQVPEKS